MMFDVCERQPVCAVTAVHTGLDSFSCRHENLSGIV